MKKIKYRYIKVNKNEFKKMWYVPYTKEYQLYLIMKEQIETLSLITKLIFKGISEILNLKK